jgi:hypothetical protein
MQDAGVTGMGQQPTPQDNTNALLRLNWMLAEWRRQRWLVFQLINILVPSTGNQTYTVGPGGEFDVAVRPDKLEYAYFRQLVPGVPNQTDYPLEILTSWEDYNRIGIKKLGTFPTSVFYDNSYPLGTLYPWPIPQASIYALNITIKSPLTVDLTLPQTLTLPEEYNSAMHWNMVVRFRAAYDLPPRPDHIGLAKNTLNVLRQGNTQITRLQLPGELLRPGIYNPYSDNFR